MTTTSEDRDQIMKLSRPKTSVEEVPIDRDAVEEAELDVGNVGDRRRAFPDPVDLDVEVAGEAEREEVDAVPLDDLVGP